MVTADMHSKEFEILLVIFKFGRKHRNLSHVSHVDWQRWIPTWQYADSWNSFSLNGWAHFAWYNKTIENTSWCVLYEVQSLFCWSLFIYPLISGSGHMSKTCRTVFAIPHECRSRRVFCKILSSHEADFMSAVTVFVFYVILYTRV